MINVNKDNIFKAFLTGLFSCITIGALTLLTYKTSLGLFLMTSFGSSMVLLYGFPENPFAQPKNIFFGHLLTAFIGILFLNYIPLPLFINIAIAVGVGIFFIKNFFKIFPFFINLYFRIIKKTFNRREQMFNLIYLFIFNFT